MVAHKRTYILTGSTVLVDDPSVRILICTHVAGTTRLHTIFFNNGRPCHNTLKLQSWHNVAQINVIVVVDNQQSTTAADGVLDKLDPAIRAYVAGLVGL